MMAARGRGGQWLMSRSPDSLSLGGVWSVTPAGPQGAPLIGRALWARERTGRSPANERIHLLLTCGMHYKAPSHEEDLYGGGSGIMTALASFIYLRLIRGMLILLGCT